MRIFWLKTVFLVLIVATLAGYQAAAQSLEQAGKAVAALEESNSKQHSYEDGIYEGSADGFNGEMKLRVVVEDGTIIEIDILETEDDPIYLDMADSVREEILQKQTTDGIDAVSGATYSSNGILNGVENALGGKR